MPFGVLEGHVPRFRDYTSDTVSVLSMAKQKTNGGIAMYNVREIDPRSEADQGIMSDIFRLRYRVFCEEKDWIPSHPDKVDIDEFDIPEAHHLACLSDKNEVLGYLRLLPTTGPYMLKDVFPVLLGGQAAPNDSCIYESSRFVIDSKKVRDRNHYSSIAGVTSALLIGLFKFARTKNMKAVVSVVDISVEKILRRSGLATTRYAPPIKIGNCLAVAGYAEPSILNITSLEKKHGLEEEQAATTPAAGDKITRTEKFNKKFEIHESC